MTQRLLKIFSPAPSSRFPLGKHKCVHLLHHQVHGGRESQRSGSVCFWQLNLHHHPSPPSPAPGPGSQGCYCWRRQDKSPRASLGKEGGEMKRVLAPWRGNKKCRKKPELRIQSTAQLPPLAFPSRMCTNTSCGRGFSSAAREIKGIPAGWGGSSAWCEAVPAPGQQQKGHRSHSAQPGLLPPALGDTGLGTTSNQRSFRWAMRKSHEDLSPAWNSCANDGRKTQRQVRAEGRGSIQGTQQ